MVKEIRDKLVTIQFEMQEGCAACNNSSCKSNRQSIQAYNRDNIALSEGETVEVQVEGKAQLIGAFWVLAFPLVLFLGAYFAGRELFPGANEAPAALCGLLGLVAGMVTGVLIQKRRRLESYPLVLRVVGVDVGADEGAALGTEGAEEPSDKMNS
jgi:positive regulator of sigma E activity